MDQLTEIISLLKEIRDNTKFAPLNPLTSMGAFTQTIQGATGPSPLNGLALGATKAPEIPVVQEVKTYTRQQVGKVAVALATKDSTKAKAVIMPFQVLPERESLAAGHQIFPSIANVDPKQYSNVVAAFAKELTPEEVAEATK